MRTPDQVHLHLKVTTFERKISTFGVPVPLDRKPEIHEASAPMYGIDSLALAVIHVPTENALTLPLHMQDILVPLHEGLLMPIRIFLKDEREEDLGNFSLVMIKSFVEMSKMSSRMERKFKIGSKERKI